MATPSESITTVNGRRCTRSRARTAATSSLTSTTESTSIESTSTTTQDAQTIQSTTVAAAPPPPPPPPSSSSTEAPPPPSSSAQPPPPPTSSAVASTAIDTSSVVSSAAAQSSFFADASPQAPAAAAPVAPDVIETTSAAAVAANPTTSASSATTATSAATSSVSSSAIVSSTTSTSTQPLASTSTAPIASSATILPDEPAQSVLPSISTSASASAAASSPNSLPEQAQPSTANIPTGGVPGGLIAPEPGTSATSSAQTLPSGSPMNVASMAGGVIGGVVGLALISALLFFCLRRRKVESYEKWQQRMSEKKEREDGFSDKLRAVPSKIKGIPAGFGLFVAKLKGNKSGPASNPYRRHTRNSSSIYSAASSRRSQSISEPASKFRQHFRGFTSVKKSRTLLHKKNDSVGKKSPFPGIVDDPVVQNSNTVENPFADPLDPPRNLQLLNPDPSSPRTEAQNSGPIAPEPAARSERKRKSGDPFASLLAEIDAQNGSGTPEWLRETAQEHKRIASSYNALRSHPTSSVYPTSVYSSDNPFFDPSDPPPVPTQLPANLPSHPANAYSLPQFNPPPSTVSRISNGSAFFFGEPGPTRPGTNIFGRGVRQSDPFDLDRPEVLGLGDVGGRTVRSSVVRQNSRKRSSTVPNWINLDDGPYEPMPTPGRNNTFKKKQQQQR